MRINIYSQELTSEVCLVTKCAACTGTDHVGIRMFLVSPDPLGNADDGDNRSAITFWLPNCGSSYNLALERLLYQMAEMIRNAKMPPRT